MSQKSSSSRHSEPISVDNEVIAISAAGLIEEDEQQEAGSLGVSCLNERISKILKRKLGIETLFPMQERVIPVMMGYDDESPADPSTSLSAPLLGDVCVCAPTGSGKTLCYAIPIVQVCQHLILTKYIDILFLFFSKTFY